MLAAGMLVLGAPASAEPSDPGAFDRAVDERIDGLGRFLERVVGDCDVQRDPAFDARNCRAAAESERARLAGRVLLLDTADLEGKLGPPEWDASRGAWRVLWTPIFGADGFGLTVGVPSRLDAAGRPVLERRPLWLERPAGVQDFVFRRDLERGMVRMELLLVLDRPWRLRRTGSTEVRGVATRLRGLRITARSGVLLEQLSR